MFDQKRFGILLIMIVLVTTISCGSLQLATPTPLPAPTPVGDTLSFYVSPLITSLAPNQFVPGTRLQFVNRGDDGIIEMRVDGRQSLLRETNTVRWKGIVARSVVGDYGFTLLNASDGALRIDGDLTLTVLSPAPVELTVFSPEIDTQLYYNNIPIEYLVPIGRVIPGTTLKIENTEPNGALGTVFFSGTSSSPATEVNNSLIWTGKIRDSIYVRYDLVVAEIAENGVRFVGTAELWLDLQP